MSKTALTIVSDAALKLGIKQPTVLFGSTGRTEIELQGALIEAADKILEAHDWQALKTLQTHTGDGSTTEFALPSDYLRMPKDAQVWSSRLDYPLRHVTPENWLQFDVRGYEVVTGLWTIFGGNFVYKPALTSSETAKFWYISDKAVTASDATTKATFTADDDTFRLDDHVLELVVVWVWRKNKKLDYAEDMRNAELALARAIGRDKGARILTQVSSGYTDATLAYPLTVTP